MCDSTLILAVATVVLAGATVWLAIEARNGTLRQIGVQTWLNLEQRFDSPEMKQARKVLAEQLDPYNPVLHDNIAEGVLDLFESIGTVHSLKLLNKKLAGSSFSWYANHWWEAAKPYIDEERRRRGDDKSLYSEFEAFVKAMRKYDPKITSEDMREFLKIEKNIKTAIS